MASLTIKVKLCYVVFILLLIVGVITYLSGFILWPALPHGQVRSRSTAREIFIGLSRSSWKSIHIVSAVVLTPLTLIHIALNWSWIKNVTRCLITPRDSKQAKRYISDNPHTQR